ncbi:hypothetical protein ABID14_001371 [Peptoniphilus olsenii]|uniref:Uncharacterized protein n=1 Tax=Peptoniphilus olsenii TaxID=411570 RepID=A0ABV2JAE5_9FIRM
MQNKKTIISVILAALLPFGMEILSKNQLSSIYTFLWAIANYLFIMTIWERGIEYKNIFTLKNLKVNKNTYRLNMIYYFAFLIFLNVYFLHEMYPIKSAVLDTLSNPFIPFVIFGLFLVNLNYGKFPEKEDKTPAIYNMPLRGQFRNGRDSLGTVVGSYEDGLVLGTYSFDFDTMKSISINKNDEVAIRGKNSQGSYIVNIGSRRSAVEAMKILVEAEKQNKLKKNIINIKL